MIYVSVLALWQYCGFSCRETHEKCNFMRDFKNINQSRIFIKCFWIITTWMWFLSCYLSIDLVELFSKLKYQYRHVGRRGWWWVFDEARMCHRIRTVSIRISFQERDCTSLMLFTERMQAREHRMSGAKSHTSKQFSSLFFICLDVNWTAWKSIIQ
jgi:hypothetical protein